MKTPQKTKVGMFGRRRDVDGERAHVGHHMLAIYRPNVRHLCRPATWMSDVYIYPFASVTFMNT